MAGLAIAVVATVLGWLYVDDRYPSWYEEVRLSDGRVITIHQRHEVFDNYGTNQSWVEIDLPELGGKRTIGEAFISGTENVVLSRCRAIWQ